MVQYGRVEGMRLDTSVSPGADLKYGRIVQVSLKSVEDTSDTFAEIVRMSLTSVQSSIMIYSVADRSVKSGATVSTTVALTSNTAADSWTWRILSDTTGQVVLTGAGATRSFIAPTTVEGSQVILGVTATQNGETSIEQTVQVFIRPHQWWHRTAAGWVPFLLK